MVHTFVGPDDAAIEVARPALEDYLRSATDLLRPHAEAFPTFRGRAAGASSAFRDLSGSDLDSLVAFAADRYLRESGLFGKSKCLAHPQHSCVSFQHITIELSDFRGASIVDQLAH